MQTQHGEASTPFWEAVKAVSKNLGTLIEVHRTRFSTLPDLLRWRFRVQLYSDEASRGRGTATASLERSFSSLSGKRLTLSFVPATTADAAALASFLPLARADAASTFCLMKLKSVSKLGDSKCFSG